MPPETTKKQTVSVNPEASIRVTKADNPSVRYSSGRLMLDEIFADGRLVTRYWNPHGQVWPEMHYPRKNPWQADEPGDVFQLGVNRQNLAGGYTWESCEITRDTSSYRPSRDAKGKAIPVVHGVVTLNHEQAGITVKVHTRLDGSPFVIRRLEITNRNKHAVGITAVAPFSGMLWNHRYEEHLPEGAVSPFELAYTHLFENHHEGDFWFESLADGCKTVDGGKRGRSGHGRPAFWARNRCNGQTFVCELAWGGNWEFELDCRLHADHKHVTPILRHGKLFFRMGLSGYDDVLRVLDAGETITTPAVHLALFQDDTDVIVQATHDHVRNVVLPAPVPGREVEIEANHRGYLCDRENVPDIIKDIDVAASLGVEMYVIDAGWYGNEPNFWARNVGDWFEGKWMKPDGGLKAVADHARKRGMKFGLWIEIEAVGDGSTLKKEHPEWIYRRDGEPVSGSRALLDLTQPEVVAFEEGVISGLIRRLKLDMYRIDNNRNLSPSGNRAYQGFTEDLTWRYYDNFYAMFDRLRAKYPKVVFQNCSSGGGRLDWGTMSRFHNTELSDWMRLPRGAKILSGVTMSLPPEILLRTFGTELSEHVLDGDVDAQLRLCTCRPIFRGIAPSLEEFTPYLRRRVEHYLGLYKSILRPVMVNGNVYHHTPFLPLTEKTPWCVLEYAKPDLSESIAVIFKTTDDGSSEYQFKPRGLDMSREYDVIFDNRGQSLRISGRELMNTGLVVRLEVPLGSELLLIQAVMNEKK
ncbi:MAG: alpha-galactosidase [Phycisphaerae bacterium]|nr:alpha-galactosidase [Phycisphaerae bacterium]